MPFHPLAAGSDSNQSSIRRDSLFNALPVPIFFVDPAGIILDANPACIEIFNKYYAGCIGANTNELLTADASLQKLLPLRKSMTEHVFLTGEPVSFEDVQNGVILRHSIYPVRSPEGAVVEACIVSQDLTPHKLTESKYRDIRSHFDFTLEKCHLGAWGIDLRDGSIFHTLEHDRIFGYESLVTQWNYEIFLDHVIPEDREMIELKYHEFIENRSGWNVEYRIRRADGEVRWLRDIGGCERDKKGKAIRMLGVTQDITDLKQWKQEFTDLQSQWNFLAGKWTIGAVVINIKENKIFQTLAHDRLLGYTSRQPEWTYEKFLEHVIPEDRESFYAAHNKTVESGEDCNVEFRIRRTDGEIRWIQAVGGVELDRTGRPYRFMVFLHDITEQKQAEIAREKLESQLQQAQKMELLGQLAGGIAHDFNNILTAILGNAQLALTHANDNSSLSKYLHNIEHSVNRSAEMIRQLLAFARKQPNEPRDIQIDPELNRIQLILHKLIEENIELRWQLNCPDQFVTLDPSALIQIITNLCINARDAISENGTITIESSVENANTCAELSVGSEVLVSDFLRITISDTGCGIDSNALPHIFEPFFTTKEVGKGTGLGLSMVYGLVKQNNGFINCRSEVGKGTKFSIFFPVAQETLRKQETSAKEPHDIEMEAVILLVEDEPGILQFIRSAMEGEGFTVLTAQTGEEAFEAFENHEQQINLVVSDVLLPGMNGIRLSQKISEKKPGMRFIFMSGYSADSLGQGGKFDEKTNFISKPFSINEFLSLVHSVLTTDKPGFL